MKEKIKGLLLCFVIAVPAWLLGRKFAVVGGPVISILLGMIVGKSREEALRLGDLFLRMIRGEASEEEIDSLEEASALRDVSHMPARVKCAMLGWRTLREALGEKTPS